MTLHDYAIQLEYIMRKKFAGDNANVRPRGTIFDADSIELYSFYDCISLVLFYFGNGDYCDFLDRLYPYKGKNIREIDNIDKVFNEFRSYLR